MLKLKEITKERNFSKNWSHYVRGFRPTEPTKEAAFFNILFATKVDFEK
jgi:hypothetical protein